MEGPMSIRPKGPMRPSAPSRRLYPSFAPSPDTPRRARLNYFKAGFIVIVGIYGLICALDPTVYRFLDMVDLVFHEAGHVLFGFFGEFIGLLGGSLMQVLIPAVVTGHFLWHGRRWSGMVTLAWVGQSLFNVSVYVKDARTRALPLLGDDPSAHDWFNILGRLGLLRWDHPIGNVVYLAGLFTLAAAVVGGLYFSRDRETFETEVA
jgi:hypothetical protein